MSKKDQIIESIIALFEDEVQLVNTWNDAILAEDSDSDKTIYWTDDMNEDDRLTNLTRYDLLKAINEGDAHLGHDYYAFVDNKILTFTKPWNFEYFDWRKLIEYVDKHPIGSDN